MMRHCTVQNDSIPTVLGTLQKYIILIACDLPVFLLRSTGRAKCTFWAALS